MGQVNPVVSFMKLSFPKQVDHGFPISIEENNIVKMAATISGPNSYSLGDRGGIELVEVDGGKVTFSNATASRPTNWTSKCCGQFYEIILS